MTAEITLLNRRALVFAADSAVTISDGTRNKIYNTAEKIFELSRIVPIGLMLYNSMEFAGVPFDVLIRKFRADHDASFKTPKHSCEEFLQYLVDFKRYKQNEDAHLRLVIGDEIAEIAKSFNARFPDYLVEQFKNTPQPDFDALRLELLSKIITDHTDVHLKHPLDSFLSDINEIRFRQEYDAELNSLVKTHLKEMDGNDIVRDLITKWALAALRSDVFSDNVTGLVFGGFGEEDLFPSAYSVELDGVFFGRLKVKITNNIDIDRRTDHAKIVPFAQSEMAERFLFGIDAEMEELILKYIKASVKKALDAIQKVSNFDPATAGITPDVYTDNMSKFLTRLKNQSRDETLDMVDFMPKQELAYAAESFVNLTSIKRKVSLQQETVGGPVDVAVITRNEGFVWIKRKHYFEVELNPGYTVRTFKKAGEKDVRTQATPRRNRGPGKTTS